MNFFVGMQFYLITMLENEIYICDRWMCWRNGWRKHVTSCAECEPWRGNYYETRENIFQILICAF